MPEQIELKFDKMLSKYVSVWIWSILFGANSGAIYSLVNYHTYMKDKLSPIIISSIIALSIIISMIAYWQLFSYLSRYLIPRLFLNSIDEENNKIHNLAAKKLKHVIVFVMLTLFLRLSIVLVEMIFTTMIGRDIY